MIHENEVADAAQEDEHMEDLVTAEVGIVPAGPLDRIEHTAHRVEDSARQEPEKSGGGEHLSEGNQSHQRHPPHKEAQSRSHPARGVDPDQSQREPRRQRPNYPEENPAPESAGPQGNQTDGSIGPGDEKIDGGVVVFAQGDTALDAGVDAVVESAGCIEPHHGQAVNQKGYHMPGVQAQEPGAQEEGHGAYHAQQGSHTVGDGRPGAQTIIGVPGPCSELLFRRWEVW